MPPTRWRSTQIARLARSTFLRVEPKGDTSSNSSQSVHEPPRYSAAPYSGRSSAKRLTRRPFGPYSSTAEVVRVRASSVCDQTMNARSVVGAASSDELVTNSAREAVASIASSACGSRRSCRSSRWLATSGANCAATTRSFDATE